MSKIFTGDPRPPIPACIMALSVTGLKLQMLLFPNALCCSLYERNCVCAVTKIFTKFLPANNFCQLLRVTPKHSCTSAGNAQAQLHFRNDQQRAFGISNISNWVVFRLLPTTHAKTHAKQTRAPDLRGLCSVLRLFIFTLGLPLMQVTNAPDEPRLF